MSLLEAMSVGVPVIASRVGEIPFMVEDGKEGFLCDGEAPPQQWAMRLLNLRDPERRRVMGATARSIVIARFQEKSMLEKYHRLMGGELVNDHDH